MNIERFEPYQIPGKRWGIELVIAHTSEYLGKVLTMRAGTCGAYQYHEKKDETFFLFSGEARVRTETATYAMQSGMSFHVPPGAKHQVTALTDCVFFECSTPVFNDRVAAE